MTALPPLHMPIWQVSPLVQALPSSQLEPFAFGMPIEQTPVDVLQVPALWHGSGAVHTVCVPPVHEPAWQVSPLVQALLSLQVVPSGIVGFVQLPVAESQLPAWWH